MGIVTSETERLIDEKGRLTLPKRLRDRLGLEAGDTVTVGLERDRIVVQPETTVSRTEFVESMEGCLNAETRDPDATRIDPLELNRLWTDDLPG